LKEGEVISSPGTAEMIDPVHGWAVAQAEGGRQLLRTGTAGRYWQRVPLPEGWGPTK
jgi:hypothetical protein